MKTYVYDWSKTKEYNTTPSEEYIKTYFYIDKDFKGVWKKNTFYKKGSVVYDAVESYNFFILKFDGESSNVDTIYDDELIWEKYVPIMSNYVTRFTEILLSGDISKYREDETYYDIYQVPSNIKIEQIAYDYYGDVNKWDVILVLNNIPTYTRLPLGNDIVIDKVYEKLRKWAKLFKYNEDDITVLNNYLRTSVWGKEIEVTNVFNSINSTGVYYLQEGTMIEVRDYTVKPIKYYVQKKIPREVKIEFGSCVTVGDDIILNINNTRISYTVQLGDDAESIATSINSLIIAAQIYGVKSFFTSGNGYITVKANETVTTELSIFEDVLAGSVGCTNFTEVDDITIKEALDDGYIVEVNENFIEITDKEEIKRLEILYDMYKKYVDEINEENNKFKFLKILKPKYLNEFKEDFLALRNKLLEEGNNE